MVLTKEDKEWIQNAFQTALGNTEFSLKSALEKQGKRVTRVEEAFGVISRAARTVIVENARKNHARLVQEMFDGSDILAVPLLSSAEAGGRPRGMPSCELAAVQDFADGVAADEYDVELAPKLGFRLVHKSRSSQKRRKSGAQVLKHGKERAKETLQLHLQYDKPFELRKIQGLAQKFASKLKKSGDGLVSSAEVRGGFLAVNKVRLAPEYLVPQMHRWEALIGITLDRVRNWGSATPASTELGFLFDVFGSEFATDAGVIELDEIDVGLGNDVSMRG